MTEAHRHDIDMDAEKGKAHQTERFNRRRQPSMNKRAGVAVLDATGRFHYRPILATPDA